MKGLLNKRNGIIAGAVILIIIAAVVVSTSFSSGMNLDEAKGIAQKYVPDSAKFISSEEEDRYVLCDLYSLKFVTIYDSRTRPRSLRNNMRRGNSAY